MGGRLSVEGCEAGVPLDRKVAFAPFAREEVTVDVETAISRGTKHMLVYAA